MKLHRTVPALLATVGAAIPLIAGAEIIVHSDSTNAASSIPIAQSPAASATSTPTASSSSSPTATPAQAAPTPTTAVPTPTIAIPTAAAVAVSRTIQGPIVQYQFGTVQATVSVTGKKITDVTINANGDEPRSQFINSQAVPYLRSETLQAQSANVNIVSGATLTSQAYAQSLQAALQQAGL
jgi:uncharacterized protein with FMN-binding domain